MYEHTSTDGRITIYQTGATEFSIAYNTGFGFERGRAIGNITMRGVFANTPAFYTALTTKIDNNTQSWIDTHFGRCH